MVRNSPARYISLGVFSGLRLLKNNTWRIFLHSFWEAYMQQPNLFLRKFWFSGHFRWLFRTVSHDSFQFFRTLSAAYDAENSASVDRKSTKSKTQNITSQLHNSIQGCGTFCKRFYYDNLFFCHNSGLCSDFGHLDHSKNQVIDRLIDCAEVRTRKHCWF